VAQFLHANTEGELGSQVAGDAAWYIVKSRRRAERVAAAALQARGFLTYLPEWRIGGGDRREFLLPGYVFVQADDRPDWQLRARSAPKVVGLLGDATGAQPVPSQLIEEIRLRCAVQSDGLGLGVHAPRVASPALYSMEHMFDLKVPAEVRARLLIEFLSSNPLVESRETSSESG
jgi:transcription antitermination factor NusG